MKLKELKSKKTMKNDDKHFDGIRIVAVSATGVQTSVVLEDKHYSEEEVLQLMRDGAHFPLSRSEENEND